MTQEASTAPLPSYFSFQYQLSPWPACVNFNFQGLRIPGNVVATCVRDQLGLIVFALPEHFDAVRSIVHTAATALIDAHAFFAFPDLPAVDLEPVTWQEVKESGVRSTVFGYADRSQEIAPIVPGHEHNRPFRQSEAFLNTVDLAIALTPALADFRSARRESGMYSGFYAYRVLEDVAYGFGEQLVAKTWVAMNEALGTTEEHWKPLTRLGTAIRHASRDQPRFLNDAERGTALGLAKEAIDRFIAHRSTSSSNP